MSEEQKPAARAKPSSYRDLAVWQKGIALARMVYEFTSTLPAEEKFGLVAQMRRAAISIPSNIAEGQARKSTREFVQFISNAERSAAELDTQTVLCVELRLKQPGEAAPLFDAIAEIRRMLNGLRRSLLSRA